ncbi:MAG: sigma-54-dependent Fis family transcriptional regulator [Deltaproteobacteria bacterium]|nr:sigma-54-dependent Fis family transcriptional regulator [Deltaproteobacteria bacterium]
MAELPDVESLILERDFFQHLVELGQHDTPGPFLEEALDLVMRLADAEKGYIEMGGGGADPRQTPFYAARSVSEAELAVIRSTLSGTIMQEALGSGQTVQTHSAVTDDRFSALESVRRNAIEAVVCAPIMLGQAPIGVIYLQSHQPARRFAPRAKRFAELLGQNVAPIASRLMRSADERSADPTLAWRAKLVASEALVGRSAGLAQALRLAAYAAPLQIQVLITGASGTGKTELARVIAMSGPRATKPYIVVNCANIPENLLESELFGAMPGAHSTAATRVIGKIAAAEGGTLCLDEVSELSPSAQAKLLTFIQNKTYFPLGGVKPMSADVRIIAATNTDLQQAVASGAFREDLFYRLNVMQIDIPPLDERAADIGPVAHKLCERACDGMSLPRIPLSPASVRALELRRWPGNVRELENCLVRAVVYANGELAASVEPTHLFPDEAPSEDPEDFHAAVASFQRKLVQEGLDACDWNVTETATHLGLSRSHLYNLIRSLGLQRPD